MQQAHPGGPAPTGCACLCFLMMKQRIAVTILMYVCLYVCLSIDFSTLAVNLFLKGDFSYFTFARRKRQYRKTWGELLPTLRSGIPMK